MGDLPEGDAAGGLKHVASHSTLFAEQNPFEIGRDNWATAERATRKIIRKVQPNSVSDERRKKVVDYIQRLIRNCLGAEVFLYGSVPLKTYLPDGDIDLTTFSGANIEDTLAEDMKTLFEEEEKNASAEFVVKDVQLVRAEVKLVKCIVEDVVVDVSFNQIGGLCTLCFLEQVDRLIGKDHLFKRSIILIKAWCYYESRILGAHHGLISTYALETMVLYIFHLFHSKLDGPLVVLFKFLDYFSKFDWETYCISLNGPVCLSTLPAIVVEMPEDSDIELMLRSEFLSSCVNMFSVPYQGSEKNSRRFQLKHLNIFDPLKENNNLGRSVSKGNFYRIRSAFSYGARKLARILFQPSESIAHELHLFFSNTVARHEGGHRPDVHYIDQSLICNRPTSVLPIPDIGLCKLKTLHKRMGLSDISTGDSRSTGKTLQNLPKEMEKTSNIAKADQSRSLKESKTFTDSNVRQTSDTNESVHAVAMPYYAPHLYFSARNRNPDSVASSKPKDSADGLTEERLNSSDLNGDYDGYVQCLQYGRWCCETGLGMRSSPLPAASYRNNSPWDGVAPLTHYKPNGFSNTPHNGLHPSPALFGMQPVLLPGVTFAWEEVLKSRGTGMYFPNMNQQLPRGYNRSSTSMKGKNQTPSNSAGCNGRNMIYPEPNIVERSSHELSQSSPYMDGYLNPNGLLIEPEGVFVFDLVEPAPGTPVSEKSRPQKPVSSSPRALLGMQRSQPSLTREQDRIFSGSSYRLKDEDDFPPLSV
ncbi:hypothetical protein OROGR_024287 [Orobanche gracilis]